MTGVKQQDDPAVAAACRADPLLLRAVAPRARFKIEQRRSDKVRAIAELQDRVTSNRQRIATFQVKPDHAGRVSLRDSFKVKLARVSTHEPLHTQPNEQNHDST